MKMLSHKIINTTIVAFLFFSARWCEAQSGTPNEVSQLKKNGNATQFFVDGKPFLIVGGELDNPTSSNMDYKRPCWQSVTGLHFNTQLTPLSWDLIESGEGSFDFILVDSLIAAARQNNMHLVFVWMASWKNGMSSYLRLWVKENYKKYLRIRIKEGVTMEVLSSISDSNAQADGKAFAAFNAIGLSPFGIDRLSEDAPLGKSYHLISQLSPIIMEKQAKGKLLVL